jgi:hypothetical protein
MNFEPTSPGAALALKVEAETRRASVLCATGSGMRNYSAVATAMLTGVVAAAIGIAKGIAMASDPAKVTPQEAYRTLMEAVTQHMMVSGPTEADVATWNIIKAAGNAMRGAAPADPLGALRALKADLLSFSKAVPVPPDRMFLLREAGWVGDAGVTAAGLAALAARGDD